MGEHLLIKPRNPTDHMNLLAVINRRVAAFEDTVSPYCHVAYLPSNAEGRPVAQSQVYTKPGESVPYAMPMIVLGIDMSYLGEPFHADTTRLIAREDDPWRDLDPTVVNEHLKRRP